MFCVAQGVIFLHQCAFTFQLSYSRPSVSSAISHYVFFNQKNNYSKLKKGSIGKQLGLQMNAIQMPIRATIIVDNAFTA